MQFFKKRDFFLRFASQGKQKREYFNTNRYTDFEKYKSYLALIDFQKGFFTMPNDAYEVYYISTKSLQITKGFAHKHFFDKDARPSTNFSYSKKWNDSKLKQKKKKNDPKLRPKKCND